MCLNCHVELWWIELWCFSRSGSLQRSHHAACLERKPRSSEVLPWSQPCLQRGREGGSTVVLPSLSCCTHGSRQEACHLVLPLPPPFFHFSQLLSLERVWRRSVSVFPLPWHRSPPCCVTVCFQGGIWSCPLAEWARAALYAVLVLVKNT